MKDVQRSNSLRALVLLLGVLVWATAPAVQVEEGMPLGLFEAQGIMRYLDLPAGIVQIDDNRYRLAPNMKWYGLNPEVSLMRQLLRVVNSQVMYTVEPGKRAPTVNAILILPAEDR